jgi:hypothetical protein
MACPNAAAITQWMRPATVGACTATASSPPRSGTRRAPVKGRPEQRTGRLGCCAEWVPKRGVCGML